jgi:hypothetical protein
MHATTTPTPPGQRLTHASTAAIALSSRGKRNTEPRGWERAGTRQSLSPSMLGLGRAWAGLRMSEGFSVRKDKPANRSYHRILYRVPQWCEHLGAGTGLRLCLPSPPPGVVPPYKLLSIFAPQRTRIPGRGLQRRVGGGETLGPTWCEISLQPGTGGSRL